MKLTNELDLISNLQQAHNFSVNEQVDKYEEEHGVLGTGVVTEELYKMTQRAYVDLADSIARAINTMQMIAGIGIQEENSAEVVSELLEKRMNDHIDWSNRYGANIGGWEGLEGLSLEERNEHIETMYCDLMEVISDTITEARKIDVEYEITLYDTKEELMEVAK